jgi:hypothetical protein
MIKSRHTLVYLSLLVLIAGYFYYFEVVKQQQREAAEREEKKALRLQSEQVTELEIFGRDTPPVRLVKDERWQIREPIQGEVEEPVLNGMLNSLATLEMERKLGEDTGGLENIGLDHPALKIRFKTKGDEAWHELHIGDKNPVGDAYYTKKGDSPLVFLIAAGNMSVLNKGANELRRRQLFTFETPAVTGMRLNWRDGTQISVTKDPEGNWSTPEDPAMAIKKSKIENVLDQIRWLRAREFVAEPGDDLAAHGLASPQAALKLQLKDGRELTLLLGDENKEQRRVTALSSDLPGIVLLEADFLGELPRQLGSLEDRSLLGFKSEQVKYLVWRLADLEGQLVQGEGKKWVWHSGPNKGKEVAEPWRVRALLWELDAAEYDRQQGSTPALPAQPTGFMELWDGERRLAYLSWENAPEGSNTAPLWRIMEPEQKLQFLEVKTELLQKLENKLADIKEKSSSK